MTRGRIALLWGVVLAGALLRAWSPGRIGIWRDEAQLLNIGALPGFGAISNFLVRHESHPPLMYFVAHVLGGAAPLSLLLLACAVSAIPLTYLLGREAHSELAGLVAAAALAFCVPVVIFSVQLRPYGILAAVLALSTLALLKAICHDRVGWRAVWAGSVLTALYLHHVGVLVLAAEVGAVTVMALTSPVSRSAVRRWLPWLAMVLLLAVPDLHLLFRQARSAGHLSAAGESLLFPWWMLVRSALGHPAVLLLPLIASAALLGTGWRRVLGMRSGKASFVILTYAFLILLMTVATYRAGFLGVQLLAMTAPVSLAIPAILIARLWEARRRVWCAVAVQALIVALSIDAIGWYGYIKTNTDQVARFIAAEARPSDLLILAPGSLGTSFNYAAVSRLSQIDFPNVGPVRLFPFDHHFQRMADPGALRTALDSIAAAAAHGRRIWIVMQADWVQDAPQPELLDPRKYASLGSADASRANLLRQRLRAKLGAPVATLNPTLQARSTEVVQAELFRARVPDE